MHPAHQQQGYVYIEVQVLDPGVQGPARQTCALRHQRHVLAT